MKRSAAYIPANHIPTGQSLSVRLGTNIGVALEYYDFVIYGLLLPYIMPLFFNTHDPIVSMAKAFSIFALGYLARPIGGLIFGQIADQKGRKHAFTSAMLLMGIATFVIGLLPTITMISPSFTFIPAFLLITCRMAQGISFGAELPSAITIVSENSNERGLACGFIISCTSIGAVSATGILALLSRLMTSEQITTWGWRIPFLLGGTLAFLSCYLRRNMLETTEFQEKKAENLNRTKKVSPFFTLLKHYPLSLLAGIGIVLVPASLGITNIFFASYMISFYNFEPSIVYSSMTLTLITSIILMPFFGWLTDRFGIKTIFILLCAILSVACPYLFLILALHNTKALLSFLFLWQCFLCAGMACALPWLTNIFPTELRCTGVALCYNGAYALAATIPTLYMFFITHQEHALIISKFLCSVALFGLICAFVLSRQKRDVN